MGRILVAHALKKPLSNAAGSIRLSESSDRHSDWLEARAAFSQGPPDSGKLLTCKKRVPIVKSIHLFATLVEIILQVNRIDTRTGFVTGCILRYLCAPQNLTGKYPGNADQAHAPKKTLYSCFWYDLGIIPFAEGNQLVDSSAAEGGIRLYYSNYLYLPAIWLSHCGLSTKSARAPPIRLGAVDSQDSAVPSAAILPDNVIAD